MPDKTAIDAKVCNVGNYMKAEANLPKEPLIGDLAETFKVFADPTRLRILFALKNNEMCVCDLSLLLDMTQSSISHQLRTLRNAKLVKARRDGKFMVYSLDDDHVHDIIDIGLEHLMEDYE